MNLWLRVSRAEVCQVCGRATWCTRSADGQMAKCMRIESHRPAKGSAGGWIHRVDSPAPVSLRPRWQTGAIQPLVDWPSRARGLSEAKGAAEARATLADSLGVSVDALVRLGVGVGHDDSGKQFSSWPERGAEGHTIGIVRRYEDGTKKHMAGGRAGLYLPRGCATAPARCCSPRVALTPRLCSAWGLRRSAGQAASAAWSCLPQF